MNRQDQSFTSLISHLVSDVGKLVRQELRLAQAEAFEKVDQAQKGTISIIAGMLLAFAGLVILLQALVLALSNVLQPWLAAVVVAVAVAIIAFVLIKGGQSSLRGRNLMPERTMQSVRDDKDMVMEKVR